MNERKSESQINGGHGSSPGDFVIELGKALSYFLSSTGKQDFIFLTSQIRSSLMREWGISIPAVKVYENPFLDEKTYRFILSGQEIIRRKVPPKKTVIISSEERLCKISGRIENDPIYSRPCVWLEPWESAAYSNSEPYHASTERVVLEHFEAVLRTKAQDFVTSDAVRSKLDLLYSIEPYTVDELLRRVNFTNFVTVMKNLVAEGIPFTNFENIVHAIANGRVSGGNPDSITEELRGIFKESLFKHVSGEKLTLYVIPDPVTQLWLYRKVSSGKKINENDPAAKLLLKELIGLQISLQNRGLKLGLICCPSIRLLVRRIFEKKLPGIIILKPEEVVSYRETLIVRTIPASSWKMKLAWHWFWLTANAQEKNAFDTEIRDFGEFVKDCKDKAGVPGKKLVVRCADEPESDCNDLEKACQMNLLMKMPPNKKQRAALALIACRNDQMKKILSMLRPDEISSVMMEIANIPQMYYQDDIQAAHHSGNNEEYIVKQVKAALSADKSMQVLSPLQKFAAILSSLPVKTAGKITNLLLSSISSQQLEELMKMSGEKKITAVRGTRGWIIEDFLWFVRGSGGMSVPLSKDFWMGEIQRIALRSPKKIADALQEIWLSWETLMQRFSIFAEQEPELAAFWIRRYIESRKEKSVNLKPAQKAMVLLQLLPDELAETVVSHLDETWFRIMSNMPRQKDQNPEEAGLVLSQFLSHYYSVFDRQKASKTGLN